MKLRNRPLAISRLGAVGLATELATVEVKTQRAPTFTWPNVEVRDVVVPLKMFVT